MIFSIHYILGRKIQVDINNIDISKLNEHDLILIKGQSIQSKIISLFNLSVEDYSHIGILAKENNIVYVLHSTPDGTHMNGIRYDTLSKFLELSYAKDYTILRWQNTFSDFKKEIQDEFDKFKTRKAPFDYDFNNKENNNIYCSELVWLIFYNSGILKYNDLDLSRPIYPKYFLKLNKLVEIQTTKIY